MQILTQIIILIILSVITHYIIAWAGSQFNEVGVVSREYANFTFRAKTLTIQSNSVNADMVYDLTDEELKKLTLGMDSEKGCEIAIIL